MRRAGWNCTCGWRWPLQSDLPTDAYAGRLLRGGPPLGADRGHERGAALRASLLAARASTRAFAHPEAARQYDQVVRLWSRVIDAEVICGTDLVTISAEAAEAGHWAGDTEAALRHIDRALADDRCQHGARRGAARAPDALRVVALGPAGA